MKNLKLLSLMFFTSVLFTACSDDDTPDPVIEEELVTTVKVTLTPNTVGLATVNLESVDLDGDEGPDPAVNDVDGDLVAGETYTGIIEFLNDNEDPVDNITEEIEALDEEHQVFFTAGSGLDVTTMYTNFDGNGNPLGTEFTVTAGAAGSGTLTITLRHEPTKPNTGLANAGGSTDAERTFSITVQQDL